MLVVLGTQVSCPAQDLLLLDIPYSPVRTRTSLESRLRHSLDNPPLRQGFESPLRRSTGVCATPAHHVLSESASDFHSSAQAHDSKRHKELLHLPPACSPCDSEVFFGSCRPVHNLNTIPRPSDGRSQHSAESSTLEVQRQDSQSQAESSSQSLERLTAVCQNWRGFTRAPPAQPPMVPQSDRQMWPGQDDSVATQHGSNDSSALQHCLDGETAEQQGSILSCVPCSPQSQSAAAHLESDSKPGGKQRLRSTANDPVSCTTPSGSLCLAQTAAAQPDQLNLSSQQHRETAAEALSCGSICRASPSGKVAGPPQVQHRGRARSYGYDVRRGDQENSSNNILSSKRKGRPGRVSCTGCTQAAGDVRTPLAGMASANT